MGVSEMVGIQGGGEVGQGQGDGTQTAVNSPHHDHSLTPLLSLLTNLPQQIKQTAHSDSDSKFVPSQTSFLEENILQFSDSFEISLHFILHKISLPYYPL